MIGLIGLLFLILIMPILLIFFIITLVFFLLLPVMFVLGFIWALISAILFPPRT